MAEANDPLGLVGTTLAGKYDVERLVAETEFSLVYRANHRVWRRPAAIKAFKASSLTESARQQLLESFVAEGALLMDLSERCAAICQARDVASVITASGDWIPYMVLEWLEGEPLDVMLSRERAEGVAPRTALQARRLLDPIAQALALAHERGIVHRDVKPGNVFVLADAGTDGACCKLLDFGIAKVATMTGGLAREKNALQSFTPAYAAPEQFSSEATAAGGIATGPWTDAFALALVFVELVTGQAPLKGKTVAELAASARDPERRPTPRSLGASVSDAVERVVRKAVSVRPKHRYANAREFWSALGEAIASEAVRDSVVPVTPLEPLLASEDARLVTVRRASKRAVKRASKPMIPGARTRAAPGASVPVGALPSRPPGRPWVFPTLAVILAAIAAGLVALQQLAVWTPPAHAETGSSLAAPAAVVQLHSEPAPRRHELPVVLTGTARP